MSIKDAMISMCKPEVEPSELETHLPHYTLLLLGVPLEARVVSVPSFVLLDGLVERLHTVSYFAKGALAVRSLEQLGLRDDCVAHHTLFGLNMVTRVTTNAFARDAHLGYVGGGIGSD